MSIATIINFHFDGIGTPLFTVPVVPDVLVEIWIVAFKPKGLDRKFIPWLLVALLAFGIGTIWSELSGEVNLIYA